MSDLLLIVTVAGERVALPPPVESVVELDTLIGSARGAACCRPLGSPQSSPDRHRLHAFAGVGQPMFRRHPRGGRRRAGRAPLRADRRPCGGRRGSDFRAGDGPRGDGPGWERVSRGMVETEEGPVLLIDIAALIAGVEAKAA